MKNLFSLLLLSMTLICFSSCKDDEDDKSSDCSGLLESGGDMEIDGETLNLSIAQLLITSGLDGDIYLFQVGGISSDCNNVKTISFSIEIPTDTDLEGTYEIKDFFDAELNDATAVNFIDQTISPINQSLVEVKSGTIEITKHADREFSVNLDGDFVGGGSVSINFRRAF
jgi:hypothetical protein